MTKLLRAVALLGLMAVVASACAKSTAGGSNAKPADFYAAGPTIADVRSLLGDSLWWPGPPSFGVRPLDSSSMPFQERFHVIHRFVHVGTSEALDIEYTLWDTTASATTQMTNAQSAFGTSATGPKVGDQVLYYGSQGTGAAPFATATFIRVGQVLITISLNLKDAFPKVALLGRIASKAATRLKDQLAGKLHASPQPAGDRTLLPPPGPDITLLGSATIPIEAIIVMFGYASPQGLAGVFHSEGVDNIIFGDYALDRDTHMEVRAGLFTFGTTQAATDWLDALRGTSTLDTTGIATFYDDGSGQYFSLFKSGKQGALLVCRSTSDTEAASRACEQPLSRVAPAWLLSLGG